MLATMAAINRDPMVLLDSRPIVDCGRTSNVIFRVWQPRAHALSVRPSIHAFLIPSLMSLARRFLTLPTQTRLLPRAVSHQTRWNSNVFGVNRGTMKARNSV